MFVWEIDNQLEKFLGIPLFDGCKFGNLVRTLDNLGKCCKIKIVGWSESVVYPPFLMYKYDDDVDDTLLFLGTVKLLC